MPREDENGQIELEDVSDFDIVSKPDRLVGDTTHASVTDAKVWELLIERPGATYVGEYIQMAVGIRLKEHQQLAKVKGKGRAKSGT